LKICISKTNIFLQLVSTEKGHTGKKWNWNLENGHPDNVIGPPVERVRDPVEKGKRKNTSVSLGFAG
jgi:hypothetical protein